MFTVNNDPTDSMGHRPPGQEFFRFLLNHKFFTVPAILTYPDKSNLNPQDAVVKIYFNIILSCIYKQGVDTRIILKWIFKKWDGGNGLDRSGSG